MTEGERGLLVVGAGGHGKSVVSVALAAGMRVAGVLDDDPALVGTAVQGVPVIGPVAMLEGHGGGPAVLALGRNADRIAVAERFRHVDWRRVVYPGCYVNPTVEIGPGTVVFPGAVIGADARIGAHVIVSGNVTVGHDTVLEDYVQVAPGVQLAGTAHVGRAAMLAIGSIVCPGVRIGARATLAAGAVAVHDLPEGCVAFGTPARPHAVVRDPLR